MSIDETGKRSSQIIDALFEEDTNLNLKDALRFSAKNLKSINDGYETSVLDKVLDGSEIESAKCYQTMRKCEYNFPHLTPEIPYDACYGKELSSSNGLSLFLSYPDSLSKSNPKLSDVENLSFDVISPVSVNNFDETKIIEDLTTDMVSSIEAGLGKKGVDVINVPETDSLKLQVSDTPVSLSSKSSSVDINCSKMKSEQIDEVSILKESFKHEFYEENALNSRTTDAKLRTLRCDDSDRQSEVDGEAKSMESESSRDFYFQYFVENFNKEEMDYRWERYDPSARRRYYQNSPKPKSGAENGLKYEKLLNKTKIKKAAIADIEPADVIINQNSLQGLAKKKFLTERAFSGICNEFSKTSSKNIDYNFRERVSEGNLARDGIAKQSKIYENITTQNINRRKSFIQIKDLEQETNISLCDTTDNDEVVLERAVKIIRSYRNICSFIERFFVSPFASVIAECIDLVIFVLVMFFCLFYLFFENVIEKKLNFAYKFEFPYNKIFRKRTIENNHGDSLNEINSEVLASDETRINEEKGFKFSAVNEEADKNAFDLNNILFIDPKDVLQLSSLEDGEDSCHFEKTLLKSEEFMELFTREKPTALITSYGNCSVDVTLQGEGMLNENDFAKEIVASPQTTGNKLYESRESSSFKIFKNAFSLNREDKNDEDLSVVRTEVENVFPSKTKSVVCGQEECIPNSIEIEDSKLIARAASGSSSGSDFNLLSFSCVDLLSSGTAKSPSNENLVFCTSLNMNLPSFSSGSDVNLLNYSLSTFDTTKDFYDGVTGRSNDCSVIEKEVEVNGDKSGPLLNLSSIGSENLVKIQMGEHTGDSLGVKNKTFSRKILPKLFKLKSLKSLQINCQQELEHSKFNSSNIVAEDQDDLYTEFENMDSVASEFVEILSNENSNSEWDSLMEPPGLPQEKFFFKRNGNLRRRMSSIFSGWKNMQMMQRVTGNLKNKGCPSTKMSKKHQKHLENP